MIEFLLIALIFTVFISAWFLSNQLSNIASSQKTILKYLENATIHDPYDGDSVFRVQLCESKLD